MGRGPTIIKLTDVERVYHTDEIETHALSGVDLRIHRGEFVSISGPSGCGKTTLLSILGLLDKPTAGSHVMNEASLDELKPGERTEIRGRDIGFIFQAFNLIGDLTVQENVELALSYRDVPAAQRKTLALEALERVEMGHRRRHLPAQLSGGQQQRVAVARAIAGRPVILLADEPTGNLDSANGEAVMSLLLRLHREGSTICMVTHNTEYAAMAQRDIHLFDGRIVDEVSRPPLEAVQ